jgi:uncharacterized protein
MSVHAGEEIRFVKPSRYNSIYSIDDSTIIAYNTFTTQQISLTPAQFAAVEAFYTDPAGDSFERAGLHDLRETLLKAGMLVPDDLDERARVAATHAAARIRNRDFNLTVIPTLACNFRCKYCFSYARSGRMSLELQDALMRFAETKMDQAEKFAIFWYGGEPTLCMDIIEGLSARLHDLAATYKVPMDGASIVTNGYRLTRPIALRLKAAGVVYAQVTLDGDRLTHDARRPLIGGRPSFDRILHNLAEVQDLLKISVRINVDRANTGAAIAALDALSEYGLRGQVKPYFALVRPYSEACGDISGACLSDREFGALDIELSKQALLRGFPVLRYPLSLLSGACETGDPLAYVVAPDGYLFKCWNEASRGADWSVGSLLTLDRTPAQEANLRMFLDWDPASDHECGDCRLLPICMGGCAHMRLRHLSQTDCATWRYVLGETLGIRHKLEELSRSLVKTVEPGSQATRV